jgi:hypothetical protein
MKTMKPTYKKRLPKNFTPPDNKTSFDVFVVVRHTRSGDKRIGVYNEKDGAMMIAEEVAASAAADYGQGSASVFPARLAYTGEALDPKEQR